MTSLNVAVENFAHPFERLDDSRIFHDHVAMMMSPTHVVGTMIQNAGFLFL